MLECYKYYKNLRAEMDDWLKQSMRMDGPGPNGGGEDEANYALAWFPHYLITRNSLIAEHFQHLLNCLENWVHRVCVHGYEPEAEVHHGTEPFALFLPRYIGLFPDDQRAKTLLEDAAHHIGNWIKGIPEWYDYERNCFYSYYIGTAVVKREKKFAYQVAEHFRFLHIALAAYGVLGESKYLDWAVEYGHSRAKQIANADLPMPLFWDLEGKELRERDVIEKGLDGMTGKGHHVPGDPLAGIENLLASGAIYAFGDLYVLTGQEIFKLASKRIIEPLIGLMGDPYHDPAASAIGYYRRTFKDASYDSQIMKAIQKFPEKPPEELAMIFPQIQKRREPGIGRRNDMIYWGQWSDDGSVKPIQEPSTAALTLAYQLTGEVQYATRAFLSASSRLKMARRVLRGGREHADMGGAICSVAAGHGRNWGQGAVTGCYGPLILGMMEIQSKVTPFLEIKSENGDLTLPGQLLSLFKPSIVEKGSVCFYNSGQEILSFSWRTNTGIWNRLSLGPDQITNITITAN